MVLTIPDNAQRVYKGYHIELRNRQQELFDGTTAVFEGIKRHDFVQIIVVDDDKILLTQEEQPRRGKFYSFVSGTIEDKETPVQAAVRELKEETGIISHDLQHIATINTVNAVMQGYLFISRNFAQSGVQHLEPGEKINPIWVSFDELLMYMTNPLRRASEFITWASQEFFIHNKHAEFKKLLLG